MFLVLQAAGAAVASAGAVVLGGGGNGVYLCVLCTHTGLMSFSCTCSDR